jgi:hypothetical protein
VDQQRLWGHPARPGYGSLARWPDQQDSRGGGHQWPAGPSALTPGEAHDNRLCSVLLNALLPKTMLLADRGYDADWIRELTRQQGAWPTFHRNGTAITFHRCPIRNERGRQLRRPYFFASPNNLPVFRLIKCSLVQARQVMASYSVSGISASSSNSCWTLNPVVGHLKTE